ncbi:hypothetical protein LV92_03851 [Arenibacter echinorum]|uniref:Uncharacterized protein n=1 Tax=Arenibacter echinorum TaxID=440515 RepID=A0A327QV11_9FLAO|nr:hypothetical protein LV92_03851 [Arenibacter echinorum]
MVTFFSILLVLIGINALLFLVSFNGSSKKKEKSVKNISESTTVIFPLDLINSKYKKAV